MTDLRILASRLRVVTCSCEWCVYDTNWLLQVIHQLFTSYLLWKTKSLRGEDIIIMSIFFLQFQGSLRKSAICCELCRFIFGHQRVIYRCLRLTTSCVPCGPVRKFRVYEGVIVIIMRLGQNGHHFLQSAISNAFPCIEMWQIWVTFDRSFYLRVQLTLSKHCFRWRLGAEQATSDYLSQWWPSELTHI